MRPILGYPTHHASELAVLAWSKEHDLAALAPVALIPRSLRVERARPDAVGGVLKHGVPDLLLRRVDSDREMNLLHRRCSGSQAVKSRSSARDGLYLAEWITVYSRRSHALRPCQGTRGQTPQRRPA